MSWLPVVSFGFAVFSFIAGWYLNERRRRSQRKEEIIDDVYPKLIKDLKRDLYLFKKDFVGTYNRSEILFPYVRELFADGRINYIKSINISLYSKLDNFRKDIVLRTDELANMIMKVKKDVYSSWADIVLKDGDLEFYLFYVNFENKIMIQEILTRLYLEFWNRNDEEIQRVIYDICNRMLSLMSPSQGRRVRISPEDLISKLDEVFYEKYYSVFLTSHKELENKMELMIEKQIIPEIEKSIRI